MSDQSVPAAALTLPAHWPALPPPLRYGCHRNATNARYTHIWKPAPNKRAKERHETLCGSVMTEPPKPPDGQEAILCAQCRAELSATEKEEPMATQTRQRGAGQPTAPALPTLPDDLAGWHWEAHPHDTGEQRLTNPDRSWSTKYYFSTEKATAEARRWLRSQPKTPARHTPPIDWADLDALFTVPGAVAFVTGYAEGHGTDFASLWAAALDRALVEALRYCSTDYADDADEIAHRFGDPELRQSCVEATAHLVAAWRAGWRFEASPPGYTARGPGPGSCSGPTLALCVAAVAGKAKSKKQKAETGTEDNADFQLSAFSSQLSPATGWHPGPDAGGVYRRPPGMAERIEEHPANLIDGRWQPRTTMDETRLQELTASIQEHGVLEDLIAIVNEQGALELVAGHRRKTAAIRAGLTRVPVKVVEVTERQATELALVSNDQRDDLTDVERGAAYEKMIAAYGISEAELARRLSRPRAYIQQRRAVATAAPAVQQALASGALTFSQARGLCAGAGGDAAAQAAALKAVLEQAKYGNVTEAQAQAHAEKVVLQVAKVQLVELGWSLDSFYHNGTMHMLIYAATERPATWTSAQILAAVREQRRPAAGEPPVGSLAAGDEAILRRRGWEVHTRTCAPWLIMPGNKGQFTVLRPDELPPVVARAKADIEALEQRYTTAGWRFQWEKSGASWRATSAAGREDHGYDGYRDAENLIKRIEAGTASAEPVPAGFACARCSQPIIGAAWSWHDNEKICPVCVAALQAERAAAIAAEAAALATRWQSWLEQAPLDLLHLLVMRMADGNRGATIGLEKWAGPEVIAPVVLASDRPVLITAYLKLVATHELTRWPGWNGAPVEEAGEEHEDEDEEEEE